MDIINEIKIINDIKITYRFKAANTDRNYLIVIFTGFSREYDFERVGLGFKTNVLWVQDLLDGYAPYYLGRNGKLDFEEAVNILIEEYLLFLGLNKEKCILLGGSKGGFASLYYGVKYNYPNIISSSFTSSIGTQIALRGEEYSKFIMGDEWKDKVQHYNSFLEDAVINDMHIDKKIYLFLSEKDELYLTQQSPIVEKLSKYPNMSLILSDSKLVSKHNQVMSYNLPLIQAIINLFIEDININLGCIVNGGKDVNSFTIEENILFKQQERGIVAVTDKIYMQNDKIYLEGDAFIKGLDSSKYGLFNKQLVLKPMTDKGEYLYPLGSVKNSVLSNKYYENVFCNYTTGGFATLKHNGISIENLPIGIYELIIEVSNQTVSQRKRLSYIKPSLYVTTLFKNRLYDVFSEENGDLSLRVKNVIGILSEPLNFSIQNLWLKEGIFHIEGYYVMLGIQLAKWREANYYLILENKETNIIYSFALGMIDCKILNSILKHTGGDYSKSAFSTIKQQGVNIEHIMDGCYKIAVSMSYKGEVFTYYTKCEITKEINNYDLLFVNSDFSKSMSITKENKKDIDIKRQNLRSVRQIQTKFSLSNSLRQQAYYADSLAKKVNKYPSYLLDNKLVAYKFAKLCGISTVDVYFQNEKISDGLFKLKYPCVLKPMNEDSGNGVFICYAENNIVYLNTNEIFNSIDSLKKYIDNLLISKKVISDLWMCEQLICDRTQSIARDIKFYMFYGQIGLILETDRIPIIRRCWRDGQLSLVKTGKYDGLLFASPEIPQSLINEAISLSLKIPSPFIRIDFLVTSETSYLGEFTPAPGRYWTFNDTWDEKLGRYYQEAMLRFIADVSYGKKFTEFDDLILSMK